MSGPEVHHLFHHPIADHSFSADRQTLAVARDNNVELYGRSGNKFILKDELKGHDKTVTGVDIAPNTGRIVTCSQGWVCPKYAGLGLELTKGRSQCLCLGTFTIGLETNFSAPPNKPRSNICTLVTLRAQIRRWIRRSCHCHLLFRRRERLVGVKALEEADTQYNHHCSLASKFSSLGGWSYGRPCKSFFQLHQRRRCATRSERLG